MPRSRSVVCFAPRLLGFLLLLPILSGVGSPQTPPQPPRNQPGWQRIQRELWLRRGRMPQSRSSAPAAALLERAQRQKFAPPSMNALLPAPSATSAPAWAPLGPAPLLSNASGSLGNQDYGPISGPVTAVAVDPNDPSGNTVYIGGAHGGVWKSSNAAAADPHAITWTPLTDYAATLSTGAIAVHPGNRQIVLVGTGQPNPVLDSYNGLGILRSADAGAHWALIPAADAGASPFAGLGFSRIAFSTATPSLVVAAAGRFLFQPGSSPDRGLYYSTDAGLTWHSAVMKDGSATVTPGSVTDVAYNPAAGKFFAAMAWHGIYSSSDGANWVRVPNQPGGTVLSSASCPPAGASTCSILRGEVAVLVDKNNPARNEMYVWYISADLGAGEFADQGIWKTTDGGATWTAISETGIASCGDFAGCGAADQGWYSLELAALPNGSGTDLYAGATNLYKCNINASNPACAARPFLNLTHAYGCTPVGSLAHVYPNQHAISFQVLSTSAVMYFGNDGGVYRALDGYGLTSGYCGQTPNAFQSLNGTLGAMSSLLSLSQPAADPGTLLAGAQENGSAATDLSHSGENGTTWTAVNGGWGGFTAIHPGNPRQWFTAEAGVSIQSCSRGIDCLAQDFIPLVTSATLGSDAGGFFTGYQLDPQASARMLVGTCRVWRGNNDGSGFAALSYNFDTGVDTPCSGSEENLISALAAGGTPVTAAGSPVVYAGTLAGRIFATADAAAGPDSWYEATPAETGYPISSIVLDLADATGKTAYAAGMGFGVPHVWKTSDAGLSWTDLTRDLPDAPVNALLIDPDDPPLLYAATDVGIFSADMTNITTGSWQKLSNGSLPNVPVTYLAMFKSSTQKLLRAATGGRGAWELVLYSPPPDYTISLDNPFLTLFPDQEGSFTGKLTALYGYNSPVSVSCEGATLPDVCTGETVTPTHGGNSYTVTVRHGSVANLSLNLKATGTDSNATAHAAAATLRVVDFGLEFAPGTPLPVSLTVNSGSNTDSVDLMVTAQGAFSGTITLGCSGLPAGATCNFYPSNAVAFIGGGSASVSMSISTLASTPNTTAVVTISAATAGAPGPKTQPLSLTVKNEPDYGFQFDPPSISGHPGDTVSARLTLTSTHNYTGTVQLGCGTSTLAGVECSLSSNAIFLAATNTGSITVTLNLPTTAVAGNYSVGVNTHDQSGSPAHVARLNLQLVPDFGIASPQATVTVRQGETATYNLQVSSLGGAFNGAVSFSCTGLPRYTGYSFAPSAVTPGAGSATVVLKVTTSAVTAALPSRSRSLVWLAMLLPFAGLLFPSRVRRSPTRLAFALGLLLCALLLWGCGGGGASSSPPVVPPPNTATPTGTYTLTVTGASGPLAHQVDLTLIVQ